MAGLPHLFDISSKKGEEFVKSLLNNYVMVSEKLDGTRFEFQKQSDQSILFYKRDPKNPISKVERTMMSVFERPIEFIEAIADSKKKLLPTDFRFGFEYFVNKKPVNTLYDKMPKNSLVLTDIKIVDSGGRTKKVITDPKILSKWANIINVDEPPVYFSGKLKPQQREDLLEFIQTPFEDLVKKFETTSFVRYILSIINPKLKKTALQNDLDKPIEGIVFKFISGPKEEFSAKMVDPLFTANARLKSKERQKPRQTPDSTAIAIMQMVEFMRINGVDSYSILGDTKDDRYIDLMSQIFVDFVSKKKSVIDGFEFDTPDFAKIPEFKVNYKFIDNKEALKLIKSKPLYHDTFKVLIGTFKKLRKRATQVIDKAMINDINQIITNIDNVTIAKNTNESDVTLSFSEFLKLNN